MPVVRRGRGKDKNTIPQLDKTRPRVVRVVQQKTPLKITHSSIGRWTDPNSGTDENKKLRKALLSVPACG